MSSTCGNDQKNSKVYYNDAEWYEPRVVGQDPLNRFMKFLSRDIHFTSDEYTNHSIRATCIQTLDRCGFEACHIRSMKLSSRKNESSIKEYATECPEDKRKEMFTSLTKAIAPKNIPTATISNPQELGVALPDDLKLEEIDHWDTIDDKTLAKIITDVTPDEQISVDNTRRTAALPTETVAVPPQATQNYQMPNQNHFQAQINTVNNNSKSPFLPQMYFPNSNVTINYHFHK